VTAAGYAYLVRFDGCNARLSDGSCVAFPCGTHAEYVPADAHAFSCDRWRVAMTDDRGRYSLGLEAGAGRVRVEDAARLFFQRAQRRAERKAAGG
jgi:hypothetical protein